MKFLTKTKNVPPNPKKEKVAQKEVIVQKMKEIVQTIQDIIEYRGMSQLKKIGHKNPEDIGRLAILDMEITTIKTKVKLIESKSFQTEVERKCDQISLKIEELRRDTNKT